MPRPFPAQRLMLAAATAAMVTGGALLPTAAFAATPAKTHVIAAHPTHSTIDDQADQSPSASGEEPTTGAWGDTPDWITNPAKFKSKYERHQPQGVPPAPPQATPDDDGYVLAPCKGKCPVPGELVLSKAL
ncbi:hypothetical protein [Streptomyces sp. NBC_01443]|uniref:hypothetical protein n=1 Tax=Streptomyces sp. NBC_01443 TaxID=2903868 RepID=UPI00225579ED|nr:hypothetical protein [Streptomyces sp. NBC_01443]MCX4632663.1 hypothetical protein [Streptomyces sp. NBC_01443]